MVPQVGDSPDASAGRGAGAENPLRPESGTREDRPVT